MSLSMINKVKALRQEHKELKLALQKYAINLGDDLTLSLFYSSRQPPIEIPVDDLDKLLDSSTYPKSIILSGKEYSIAVLICTFAQAKH